MNPKGTEDRLLECRQILKARISKGGTRKNGSLFQGLAFSTFRLFRAGLLRMEFLQDLLIPMRGRECDFNSR